MTGRELSVPLLGVVRSGGSFSRQCDPKQVNSKGNGKRKLLDTYTKSYISISLINDWTVPRYYDKYVYVIGDSACLKCTERNLKSLIMRKWANTERRSMLETVFPFFF